MREREGKPPVRVMLVQDLTGLITMRREKRDAIFGQLREIYDGRLVKSTGMGEDLRWEGYLGLLGAVTPKYDDVAELYSVLGERFVLYRMQRDDAAAEARAALDHERRADGWRDRLASVAAKAVRVGRLLLPVVMIPAPAREHLIALAQLTAAGRAAVSRDGYNKVIRVVPEPEGPARLVQQFEKLLMGLCAVRGCLEPGTDELAIIRKVARDTVPRTRLLVVAAVSGAPLTRAAIVRLTKLPGATCTYHLQDLHALGVVEPYRDAWRLAEPYRRLSRETGFGAEREPSRIVGETRTGTLERVALGGTSRDSADPTALRPRPRPVEPAPSGNDHPHDDGDQPT